jgi:hypothetical protein
VLSPGRGRGPCGRAAQSPPRDQISSANGARCRAARQMPTQSDRRSSRPATAGWHAPRSASSRSTERATARNSARCSAVVTIHDRPDMFSPHPVALYARSCHMWMGLENPA